MSDDELRWATEGLPPHPYRLHRVTVDDLYRLVELQLIGEGVELIRGLITHRGTSRLVAYFPSDHEATVGAGIVAPGRTVFVDGAIEMPLRGCRYPCPG